MNPEVDAFIDNAKQWPEELKRLQGLLLECGLTEELKWKQPCYCWEDNNIVILGEFSDGCRMTFFKGALLSDPEGLLSKPGPNTRGARMTGFTSVDEIDAAEAALKAYVKEAIEIEKDGRSVNYAKNRIPDYPDELQEQLDADPEFREAFEALTPGRQRGYLIYFADAKQSATRSRRVEKYRNKILAGKGMQER